MYLDSYAGANPSQTTPGFVTVTATIDGKDVVKTYTEATAPAAALPLSWAEEGLQMTIDNIEIRMSLFIIMI